MVPKYVCPFCSNPMAFRGAHCGRPQCSTYAYALAVSHTQKTEQSRPGADPVSADAPEGPSTDDHGSVKRSLYAREHGACLCPKPDTARFADLDYEPLLCGRCHRVILQPMPAAPPKAAPEVIDRQRREANAKTSGWCGCAAPDVTRLADYLAKRPDYKPMFCGRCGGVIPPPKTAAPWRIIGLTGLTCTPPLAADGAVLTLPNQEVVHAERPGKVLAHIAEEDRLAIDEFFRTPVPDATCVVLVDSGQIVKSDKGGPTECFGGNFLCKAMGIVADTGAARLFRLEARKGGNLLLREMAFVVDTGEEVPQPRESTIATIQKFVHQWVAHVDDRGTFWVVELPSAKGVCSLIAPRGLGSDAERAVFLGNDVMRQADARAKRRGAKTRFALCAIVGNKYLACMQFTLDQAAEEADRNTLGLLDNFFGSIPVAVNGEPIDQVRVVLQHQTPQGRSVCMDVLWGRALAKHLANAVMDAAERAVGEQGKDCEFRLTIHAQNWCTETWFRVVPAQRRPS